MEAYADRSSSKIDAPSISYSRRKAPFRGRHSRVYWSSRWGHYRSRHRKAGWSQWWSSSATICGGTNTTYGCTEAVDNKGSMCWRVRMSWLSACVDLASNSLPALTSKENIPIVCDMIRFLTGLESLRALLYRRVESKQSMNLANILDRTRGHIQSETRHKDG